MMKAEAKRELENYVYDFEYYREKISERERYKDEVRQSLSRVKELNSYSENGLFRAQKSFDAIIASEAREEETLVEILNRKQKIESVILKMEQPYKTIIYLKYMRFYTFDQISEKMHYSTKRIYQLHAIAIDRFAELYMSEQ